jgi:TolB-like protein/DNA-binding winged helix-turn-helix (wHTH) protein
VHSYNGDSVNDSSAIEIGGCTVRPTRNLLERNGRSIKIVPRTMDTLIYLAEHAGEVVSVEELIGAVWRGRIVNDAQIYKSMSQLRQALGELREDVEFIQTVPKRGYRLVTPVTPARQHGTVSVAGDSGTVPGRKFGFAVGGILALTLAIIVGRSMQEDDPLNGAEASGAVFATPHFSIQASQPEHFANSVAVLPFENLSLNPEDAHFAAGVHEEILNHLTKIDDLRVVARASVLPYAGAAQPIFEIADELRVGTIMVGSVRYADGRVRIVVQLIDTATGAQLWSEAYEHDFSEIFTIQTDIATRVAMALEARLTAAQQLTIQQQLTDSPEAYALYLRAGATDLALGLPTSLRHLYLDRAIALDPEFARAHARKANAYTLSLVNNVASGAADLTDLAELDRLSREHAEKALALDL